MNSNVSEEEIVKLFSDKQRYGYDAEIANIIIGRDLRSQFKYAILDFESDIGVYLKFQTILLSLLFIYFYSSLFKYT